MEDVLQGLTDEQRQAACHGEGPLLIVAGAGTGKTTVITRRIVHLILSGQAQPGEILALTFTDKAAQEMQERVDVLLPMGFVDTTICTFHSFGDKILRQFALELGLQQDYRMLDDTGQVLFLRHHLFRLPLRQLRPLGNPTTHLRALKQHFGRLKDECVDPEVYVKWADELAAAAHKVPGLLERAELQQELALCYRAYQELLQKDGRCDFADLVYQPLNLLRNRPGALQRLQQKYRFLLVDEFQDTNGSQFELVRLLAAGHQNLTVVGDDDQSIYAFRGAAISNILQFMEFYPQAKQSVLTQNYRSLQPILDASYGLIQNNNPQRLEVINQIDKRLISARQDLQALAAQPLEYTRFETVSDEAEAVAQRIVAWVEEYGLLYADFAILIRNNRDSNGYLRALNQFDVPYRFSGNEGLYRRPEVRLLTSIVRVLVDPHDGQSLFYLLSSDFYACSARDLVRLSNYAQREHGTLLAQVERALHEQPPELNSLAILQRFYDDYQYFLELIPKLQPGPLIYQFLQRSDWWRQVSEGEVDNAQALVQNVARFFDVIGRFSEEHEQGNLADFVLYLDLLIESGDSPSVVESDTLDDAVQVLTIHRSKGLEFPVVFLVGLNEDRFPNRLRPEDLEFPWPLLETSAPADELTHLQEERRLFYVALTRAQRHLWLSGANDTGLRRKQKPSRFVREALGRAASQVSAPRMPSLERIRRAAPVQPAPRSAEVGPPRVLDLSHQRIHDYLDCPHRYYLAHVMRIPQPESHNQTFGTALHDCISWYLKQRKEEQRTASLPELHERFRAQWRRVGCLNGQHAEHRLEQGLECLERFWQDEAGSTSVPQMIEQEFVVRLDDVRIRGRIDRVDQDSAGRVKITDYKSSPVRTQDKADDQARSSLQLSIYAFAYQVMQQRMPDQMCLHFVETGLEGTSRASDHPLGEHTGLIRQAVAGIRAGQFEARPALTRCRTCNYRSVCNSSADA
ncbi:ATP-dependent helicase [bacterium]|nr:ATP-dependent helicase [bacterium]